MDNAGITLTGKQLYDAMAGFPKIGVMTRQGNSQNDTAQQNTYTLYNSDCIQWSWNPDDTVYEIAIGDTTVNGTMFDLQNIGTCKADSPYLTYYNVTSDTMEDPVAIGFIEK